jgi:hypothetical protein
MRCFIHPYIFHADVPMHYQKQTRNKYYSELLLLYMRFFAYYHQLVFHSLSLTFLKF